MKLIAVLLIALFSITAHAQTFTNASTMVVEVSTNQVVREREATNLVLNISRKGYIHETTFNGTNLPTGWTSAGGTWVVNNSLSTPAGGGWGVYALYDIQSKIDAVTWAAKITINSTNSEFCLIRKDKTLNTVGIVATLRGAENKIGFYSQWDGTSTPTALYRSNNLATPVVANRDYLLTLSSVDHGHHAFTVTDLTSGSTTTVTADSGAGAPWDGPGFMHISGSVTVKWCGFSTPFPKNPKVLFLGDSFTAGNSLTPNEHNRYCARLLRYLGGNAAIAGRGGETTTTVLDRLDTDLDFFKPRYVHVLLGANDTTNTTWTSNIMTISNRVDAIGAELILGTVAPRNDSTNRQSFFNDINPWIRTNGLAFVDYAKALTTDNDGVTFNESLAIDTVHPNAEGHLAMFRQAIADCPDVFEVDSDTGPFYTRPLPYPWPSLYTPYGIEIDNTNDNNTYYGNVNQPYGLSVKNVAEPVIQAFRNVGNSYYGLQLGGNTAGPVLKSVGAHKFQIMFDDQNTLNLWSNKVEFAGTNFLQGLRVTNAVDGLILTDGLATNKFSINGTVESFHGTNYWVGLESRGMNETGGVLTLGIATNGGFHGVIQGREIGSTNTHTIILNEYGGSVKVGTGGLYLYDSATTNYQPVIIGTNDSGGIGYRMLMITNSP